MSILLILHQHIIATNSIVENTGIQPGGLPQAQASSSELQNIINIDLNIIGAVALLVITVSGLRYILSAGDPEKVSRAKNGIIYGLVGLVIAVSADAIVAFVANRL